METTGEKFEGFTCRRHQSATAAAAAAADDGDEGTRLVLTVVLCRHDNTDVRSCDATRFERPLKNVQGRKGRIN